MANGESTKNVGAGKHLIAKDSARAFTGNGLAAEHLLGSSKMEGSDSGEIRYNYF